MLRKRGNIIKAQLAKHGIKQCEIARELKVTSSAVYSWTDGRMPSSRITNWFRNKFGDDFVKRIEIPKK